MTTAVQQPARVVQLTRREGDVLAQLCYDGADNATIARRLGCAEETVKTYIHRLLAVMDCHTRTALVVERLTGRVQIQVGKGRYPPPRRPLTPPDRS